MGTVNVPVNFLGRGGVVAGASASEVTGDPVNGHFISPNNGRAFFHVRNLDAGASHWFEAVPALNWDGVTLPNKRCTIPASGQVFVGPYPVSMYGARPDFNVDSAQLRIRAYVLSWQGGPSGPLAPGATAAPRIDIPVTAITRDGVAVGSGTGEVTFDAANDHSFANDGNVVLHVRNVGGSDISYNFASPLTLDGQPISDYVSVVQAAAPEEIAGSWDPKLYNQTEPDHRYGRVLMNVTSANGRVKAYRLPYQE